MYLPGLQEHPRVYRRHCSMPCVQFLALHGGRGQGAGSRSYGLGGVLLRKKGACRWCCSGYWILLWVIDGCGKKERMILKKRVFLD